MLLLLSLVGYQNCGPVERNSEGDLVFVEDKNVIQQKLETFRYIEFAKKSIPQKSSILYDRDQELFFLIRDGKKVSQMDVKSTTHDAIKTLLDDSQVCFHKATGGICAQVLVEPYAVLLSHWPSESSQTQPLGEANTPCSSTYDFCGDNREKARELFSEEHWQ